MFTLFIAMLQSSSGLAVNPEVPVWGIFMVIIGAVAAFAALRMQMLAHEKNDDQRFAAQTDMLVEIRRDVREIRKDTLDIIRRDDEA